MGSIVSVSAVLTRDAVRMNTDFPPLAFARDMPPAVLNRRIGTGELIRAARGIYVRAGQDPKKLVRGNWSRVAGYLFPGAVISGRSAPSGAPVGDTIFLAKGTRMREKRMAGLNIVVAAGAGAVEGDVPIPGGLYLASKPRAILDNLRSSRSTRLHAPWSLRPAELEEWLDRLRSVQGEAALRTWLEELPAIAAMLHVPKDELVSAEAAISSVLGDKQGTPRSHALRARREGRPFDQERVRRFRSLILALQRSAPQAKGASRADRRWSNAPFFEACFSNYIEGVKFQLDQAIGIIFRNETVPQREPEVQDLAGTYAVVSDVAQMSTVATSGAEFLEILKHRHRQVMRGRPEYAPGSFKTRPNSAGRTVFVQPELVEGTLVEGFTGLLELDGAFQRAVYTMFLVSEVHPFIDGNGRVARIAMNAELVAKDEARIIIPPVFQDDYLGALRRLSRGGDPRPVIQALRFAQDVVAACDFSTLASARSDLETAHAFHEGDEGFRLRIPDLTTRASGDATTA